VLVQLQVEQGWHIHANPPGDEDVDIATELALESKLDIELANVLYPAGKKVPREDGDKPQLHYVGKVDLIGEIEVPAEAAGQREDLVLLVNYQACNDSHCLKPTKLKLKLPVTVARRGEAVKAINQSRFAPPNRK
jgi:DsbC/DsbD-like thiol-disulfide interchange protein